MTRGHINDKMISISNRVQFHEENNNLLRV